MHSRVHPLCVSYEGVYTRIYTYLHAITRERKSKVGETLEGKENSRSPVIDNFPLPRLSLSLYFIPEDSLILFAISFKYIYIIYSTYIFSCIYIIYMSSFFARRGCSANGSPFIFLSYKCKLVTITLDNV